MCVAQKQFYRKMMLPTILFVTVSDNYKTVMGIKCITNETQAQVIFNPPEKMFKKQKNTLSL